MIQKVILQGPVSHSRGEVEKFIGELPNIISESGLYLLEDEEVDTSAELRLFGGEENVDKIEVTLPEELPLEPAQRLASFCNGMALRLGWSVKNTEGNELSEKELVKKFLQKTEANRKGCLFSVFG
jgi:hypothetical protein